MARKVDLMKDFTDWAPMRIYWREGQPMVDWCYLGARRFTDPFYEQTIMACMSHPADLLFRHQTPLEFLGELAESQPGLPPTGFIFHMSRCGSTLISQMLAAVPKNIVISEASPIDRILRDRFNDSSLTAERRVQWLRSLVSVLGRARNAGEKHFFIKFDCWHTLFLPLIRRAFPNVPWIFVYREPLEVMVSHAGQRGGQMIPGVLEPELFGWDREAVGRMNLDEYGARALAKICEAALVEARRGTGKLVNYRQLPGLVWPTLMNEWSANFLPAEIEQMAQAARQNAKNPVLAFEQDTKIKNERATEQTRTLAKQWLAGVYQDLETQRAASGFA